MSPFLSFFFRTRFVKQHGPNATIIPSSSPMELEMISSQGILVSVPTKKKTIYYNHHNCMQMLWSRAKTNSFGFFHLLPFFFLLGHCVENLRAAIVCHSDVTPVTFHWNRRMQSIVQKLETPHKCRNFEKIRRWAGERRVPFDDRHYPFVWVTEQESGAVV